MEVAPQIYEAFPVFVAATLSVPPAPQAKVNKHALHLYVCKIAPCWNPTGAASTLSPAAALMKPF